MRETDVPATRIVDRATGEDAPFFIGSGFGSGTYLRGYSGGRWRDRMIYALQSEYRKQLNYQWIPTGFAGFGEVASSMSDFGDDFPSAAALAARFVISHKHRVALTVDTAVRNDGAEGYFGVGEAFWTNRVSGIIRVRLG